MPYSLRFAELLQCERHAAGDNPYDFTYRVQEKAALRRLVAVEYLSEIAGPRMINRRFPHPVRHARSHYLKQELD